MGGELSHGTALDERDRFGMLARLEWSCSIIVTTDGPCAVVALDDVRMHQHHATCPTSPSH